MHKLFTLSRYPKWEITDFPGVNRKMFGLGQLIMIWIIRRAPSSMSSLLEVRYLATIFRDTTDIF